MAGWEYKVVEIGLESHEAEARLAELGGEAWELVAVLPSAGRREIAIAFLKRPAPMGRQAEDAEPSEQRNESDEESEDGPETFEIVLTEIRGEPASVVLSLTRVCPWLHLKDAKRSVESRPARLAAVLQHEEAERLQVALMEGGVLTEMVPRSGAGRAG